jgi:hypothetical protein
MLLVPSAWSLAARIAAPLLVLGLLAAAVWGYGMRERRAGLAEVRAEWVAAKERQRQVDAAETLRRIQEQQEVTRAAQDQTRRARADAAAAGRAADRLRDAYADALKRRCDPAAAAGGAPASGTADLLADVRSRIDAAAGELAAVATARGVAGAACVRAYESLTHTPPRH